MLRSAALATASRSKLRLASTVPHVRRHLSVTLLSAPKLGRSWAVGLMTCGEADDVVGALTLPLIAESPRFFHDLLVELRLLLVAEVKEGKEEDRQEEGEEVKGGSQVEETTTTWMAMMMVVGGVRTWLELEPM